MIYLATRYNNPDPSMRLSDYEHARDLAWKLISAGVNVCAPVLYRVELCKAQYFGLTLKHWEQFDSDMLGRCDGLIVSCDGKHSEDIAKSVSLAKSLGMGVLELTKHDPDIDLAVAWHAALQREKQKPRHCNECKWYNRMNHESGNCHLNPPSVHGFSVVRCHQWCSHFERRQ